MVDSPFFDARPIPDEGVAAFRQLALKWLLEVAPALGEWTRKWCETEEFWRATRPGERPHKHLLAIPPAWEWSDKDLALGLRAATTLSYKELPETWSPFLDRLVMATSEEAANRLEKR